ncbi:MAG: FtsX-like permease family protein [Atopobiaceae bacterium]|nr:FtsX-like permease family protein [Atopobiaceae bacterium]
MTAFSKTIVRSIRGSLGRFLAIMGIVALGCGFFAGLQMCGPDMRAAAHELYSGTNAYDIRVVSTLGFGENDVERVRAIEGIGQVMPVTSCDAMARLGSEQMAVRMSSLSMDAAKGAVVRDANVILSDDGAYLNRVFLREGRWPRKADECVLEADKPIEDVGVGSRIEVLSSTSDLDDVLRKRSFKVVGLVSSSIYPYTGSFGSTTLGSGMIGAYLYVASSAFVKDMPYTELYASVEGAHRHESGSDAYDEVVDEVRRRLEDKGDVLADERLADVRKDAQDELDEKRADYEEERADALDELDDAKRKLKDARKELDDAQEKIDQGEKDYAEGTRTYEDSRADAYAKLDDAQATLDSSYTQLVESGAELDFARAQLEDGTFAYEEGVAQLLVEVGASSLDEARAQLAEGQRQADEGVAQATSALDSVDELIAGLEELEAHEQAFLQGLASVGVEAASVAEAQTALDGTIAYLEAMGAPEEQVAPLREARTSSDELVAARNQLEAGRTQLLSSLAAQGLSVHDELEAKELLETRLAEAREAQAQVSAGFEGIARLDAAAEELARAREQLADGEWQLEDGWNQLEAGQDELNARSEDAERELADVERKLDDAREELESGKADLKSGTEEYESSNAEYEDAREEAEEKLADAERKLDDAQKDIDEIEAPDVYVLDRSQNEGMLTYDADSRRMDSIADVFPFIFFLVAALVALTTMTRMVEDDRIELGTYKALGYTTARIASKYLVYAGAAGAVGAFLGILALSQVLPFIVTSAYSIIYTVPLHPFPLPIDLPIALLSGGLGVGVTLVATWAAVVSSLRETPATLMLPRAPAPGKRILLERVKPVWRRLSFSWKVTCRNMFRYKRRLAMTVVGISGCTALLLVGFGLHDSIWDIIDCQYGPIIHYDTTIVLDDDAKARDVKDVVRLLEKTGEVSGIVRLQQENMQAGTRDNDETIRVQVVVPQDEHELADVITLQNRLTGEKIPFDGDSVVITEKLSLKYGLSAGGEILLYDQDTIGNAVGDGHALTVTGIAENYVGNLVYVGGDAWRTVDEEEPVYSALFATTTADDEVRADVAAELRETGKVSTVVFSDETINLYRNMLSVVDMVVVLLIVSAGALAFIVLYNLTNINIGERVREIASLKVLGFTRQEVYAYIFREIFLLAIIGDVLGMVFGTWLETFVAVTAEVDYVMFGRTIHPMSYAYAFVLTIVFCALIMFAMRRKLDRVNMVESLKSVD